MRRWREHRVVGGDVEKEKKRNGPTNAGTCTSVVWAYGGADRKAIPPKNVIKNIIIIIIEPCSQQLLPSTQERKNNAS